MIEQMNHLAQGWWDWMSAMFWQVGLLILLIALIDLLIRKWAWPQLRYALWSLVLIKLVLSPTLSLPSGLAPKLKPVVARILESAGKEELIEINLPIKIPSANDEFRRPVVRYSPPHPAIVESNDSIVWSTGEYGENDASPPRAELVPPPVETPVNTISKHKQSDEPMPDKPLLVAQSIDDVIVPPEGPRLGWRVYAMAIWFLGVVTLSTWLFVKLRRLSKEYIDKSRDGGQSSLPESFYNQLDRCAQQLNLRRKPKVVITRRIQSPAVFGLFSPILLMPVGYIRRLSRKDTEYMLLHELAHIKRGDMIAHSLCMLIQLAYWYNPLLWLVCKQLRHLRELCCDATVASLLRDKTAEYRQTLLETARRFLATPAESGLGLVGLFEDSNRLIARINWLKKPVWRYRKMKNIAVITTVLILLACVLPMAQGQNPQAQNLNVSSEQTEEKTSQSQGLLTETEQSPEAENEQLQNQEQLKAMQLLMVKLEQLQIEKQKIEKELQSLMQAQEEAQKAKSDVAQAKMETEKAKNKVVKVMVDADVKKVEADVRKADAERRKADAEMQKADAMANKADADVRKAEAEAKQWEQWAKQMEMMAQQYSTWANSPEVQERISGSANDWAEKWINSDQFKQWQKEMEKWAKEQAKAHEKAKEGRAFPAPAPTPKPHPMPVMPTMPPMPVEVNVETEVEVNPEIEMEVEVEVVDTPEVSEVVAPVPPVPPTSVPTPPEPPILVVPTPPVPPSPPSVVAPAPPAPPEAFVMPSIPAPPATVEVVAPVASLPVRNLPLLGVPAATVEPAPTPPNAPPMPKPDRDVKISKGKDDKYVATTEMHFTSKVEPGSPFVIRNNLGNIILRPSKDSTCEVKAVIRAEAKTASEAQKMVEEVAMNVDSSKEKFYLKPVKSNDDQWSNLSVELTIVVPLGVRPDIKTGLGNVELFDLKGSIKALTDLGSVKAINTTGDLDLISKMGDVEFTAPKNLSAKLRAETKMGSIKSDLPLNINKTDMFKRTAEGTIGSGRDNIRLTTDMGSIHIKNQSQNSSANNPQQLIVTEEITQNSADKLKIEQSISNSVSSKISGTVQSIKEEQQDNRHIIKRIETMATPLAPGSVLDITNEDGNITVQGSDTDQCLINSTFTIRAPSIEEARDLSKKVSLNTTPGSKKLTLKAVYPRNIPQNHSHQIDLQITVSRNTSVTLHKADGNIRFTNLEGQIQIASEDGDITCENIIGNAHFACEDGNVNIKKSRLAGLTIKKEDGNVHCDDINGNCDISIGDGNVTISYAEDMAENCTCIVRGEDGNVKISKGTFANCQVKRESGTIHCDKVRGNLEFELESGQVVVDYADSVPKSCSINVRLEEGSIRLSAPGEMFPADAPSQAKRLDEGAEWKTTTNTPGGGTRTVSLHVDEGSVKVEKR